jgi:hypothetical protein
MVPFLNPIPSNLVYIKLDLYKHAPAGLLGHLQVFLPQNGRHHINTMGVLVFPLLLHNRRPSQRGQNRGLSKL